MNTGSGRRGLAALLLAFGVPLWLGCTFVVEKQVRGSGHVTVETRSTINATGVALMALGDLDIEISDREELRIEAEDNLLSFIETEIVDGVLQIRQHESVVLEPSKSVRFHLAVPRLDHILFTAGGHIRIPRMHTDRLTVQHRGSGRLEVAGLNATSISIHGSGSGEVVLQQVEVQQCRLIQSGSGNLQVRHLEGLSNDVRLTGSGDITIHRGSVVQQSAFVSGSGDLKASGLRTSATEVMASGSGSAAVHAGDRLDATVTGGGDIRYRGKPVVYQSISGSGEVIRIR